MFYLAMAFIAVWLLVTFYVVYMGRKQTGLEQELSTLEELVSSASAPSNE